MKKIIGALFLILFSYFLMGKEDPKKLKQEIEKLTKLISSLNVEAKDVLTEIEKLDLEILNAEKKISYIRYQLSNIRKEIKDTEMRLDSLNEELKSKRRSLKRAFVLLYENRNSSPLELYFAGKDILSVVENINLLKIVSNKIYKQYNVYKEIIKEIKKEQEILKEKEKRKEKILFERKRAWTEYLNKKNEKRQKIKEILKKRENYLNLLKIKKKELEKITHIIEKEKNINRSNFDNSLSFYSLKGELIWPIRGRVVERFGIKRHPKYNIKLKSNGIEIKPRRNFEKVRAVYDGVIVYAGYVKSYGNTVIIEHPGKYYTLYSHLKDIFVEKNKIVKKGEVIGITGNTGVREFDSLYFSIRKGVTPLNPIKWLKPLKKRRRRR